MLRTALFLLPPLLIFGLYHMGLWFNLMGLRRMVFWRRVATSSAAAHVLFAAGALLVAWVDFGTTGRLIAPDMGFDAFLLAGGEFWRLLLIFDTLPAVAMIGILGGLDYLGMGVGPIVPVTFGVILVLGTLQWYWIGGALGALGERVWSGLKTQDGDGPDWL
jgi:hypothetical protein